MKPTYNEQDYIQTADDDNLFGHRGDYKYRVLDKNKEFPTHHTNSYEDAKKWFNVCVEYWKEQDE